MIWFAYALKIWNKDILYNNAFGMNDIMFNFWTNIGLMMGTFMLITYLSVKSYRHYIFAYFLVIPVAMIFYHPLVTSSMCGTIGTTISILGSFTPLQQIVSLIDS